MNYRMKSEILRHFDEVTDFAKRGKVTILSTDIPSDPNTPNNLLLNLRQMPSPSQAECGTQTLTTDTTPVNSLEILK